MGEVVDGRWREYERATMPVAGLRLDDAMGRSLVLVGPRQNLARLGAQVVRRW
ncbi:MAG TPA: hypothetical protein VLH79_09070 [Chthonomonadales bacterium]|nr:hypothetical protein [Chthonomonadales bacterium]